MCVTIGAYWRNTMIFGSWWNMSREVGYSRWSTQVHLTISIPNDCSPKQLCKERKFFLPVFISTSAASFMTLPLTIRLFDSILASNITRPKQMPHPTEFFLDMEKYYYILLTITFVGYIVCAILVNATDSIYFALLQHICGTLTILRYFGFILWLGFIKENTTLM